ncbi:hypothetical protein B0H15DRAFT_1020877 [Mycena belliarum]|uniref:Uncharacterized protein n=1 Tax=Mycena belliarum TaxID=1033014 RepID=A0AAD6U7U4_9AGAR|nr:hypothetical protein B0H15DRAFT_1020877 [Mycena belliae]
MHRAPSRPPPMPPASLLVLLSSPLPTNCLRDFTAPSAPPSIPEHGSPASPFRRSQLPSSPPRRLRTAHRCLSVRHGGEQRARPTPRLLLGPCLQRLADAATDALLHLRVSSVACAPRRARRRRSAASLANPVPPALSRARRLQRSLCSWHRTADSRFARPSRPSRSCGAFSRAAYSPQTRESAQGRFRARVLAPANPGQALPLALDARHPSAGDPTARLPARAAHVRQLNYLYPVPASHNAPPSPRSRPRDPARLIPPSRCADKPRRLSRKSQNHAPDPVCISKSAQRPSASGVHRDAPLRLVSRCGPKQMVLRCELGAARPLRTTDPNAAPRLASRCEPPPRNAALDAGATSVAARTRPRCRCDCRGSAGPRIDAQAALDTASDAGAIHARLARGVGLGTRATPTRPWRRGLDGRKQYQTDAHRGPQP